VGAQKLSSLPNQFGSNVFLSVRGATGAKEEVRMRDWTRMECKCMLHCPGACCTARNCLSAPTSIADLARSL